MTRPRATRPAAPARPGRDGPPRPPLPAQPRRHAEARAYFDEDGALLLRGPRDEAPLRADYDSLDVLALCDGERTLDELASAMLARGAFRGSTPALARALLLPILHRLHGVGLLVGPEASAQPDEGYARPWVHRLMLQDEPRTESFRRALEAVVKKGDRVIDVGTGTGILAIFAARAGASEVHAVERSGLAATAAAVARASGQGDVVHVHHGDARSLELKDKRGKPLQAQVLVSEWIGHFAVTEGMFPSVTCIRDRHLAPGGVMIPSRVEMLVAPVEDPELRRQGPGFWFEKPWGIDVSAVGELELGRPTTLIDRVPPDAPLSKPAVVHAIDCTRDGPESVVFDTKVEVVIERDGTLDGLCGWFTADLAPGIVLDTSPASPMTHWRQHLFPIRPVAVKRGARLAIRLSVDDASMTAGMPTFELRMALDGEVLVDSPYAPD